MIAVEPSSPSEASADSAFSQGRWLRADAWTVAQLTLVVSVAAGLRLYRLGGKSFWLDEAYSVEIARLPWSEFFELLWIREANMALYYLVLRFWLYLGASEASIRALSVLISVATVPLIYALGKRLFGTGAGLLAAWLLALNAYHIRYAQEARSYALLMFFSVLATWLLVRNLQEPSRARWGAYTTGCVLAVYSHVFGLLIALSHWASFPFLRRDELARRELLRSLTWFVGAVFPVLLFAAKTGTGPVNWIEPTTAKAVMDFFVVLAGNYGLPLLALVTIALVLAGSTAWETRQGAADRLGNWPLLLTFACLFVPVLAMIALSMVSPFFVARYLSSCLPPLILLVSAGLVRLRPRALAWTLCAAISVCSLLGTRSYYRQDFDLTRDDWRAASSFILDRAQPGDGIFFYMNSSRVPFEFYRSQKHPAPVWPEALSSAGGDPTRLGPGDFLFVNMGEALRDARPPAGRVWLLLAKDIGPGGEPNRVSVMLRAMYGKNRRLRETQKFSDITILLYAPGDVTPMQALGPDRRDPAVGH